MVTTFYIVPHTHWDREWYEPFQVFRSRLVDLVDDLIPVLENDRAFKHFMLDGQMAVIDDYLEIRPEMESRLRALVADGRLAIGPWQILMDEFLVSGENTIRNLRQGLARASQFGAPMPIGYLPDMFGHISQMPQILKRAGISNAVVWRGVPAEIGKTVFEWRSPDGSAIRTCYLATSYSNGAQLPLNPDQFKTRMNLILSELSSFEPDGAVLVMNGTDHIRPQPELGQTLAAVQDEDKTYKIASLWEYLAALPAEAKARWDGELRSGARANLLMGVNSNRMDVRIAAARTENLLERYAEPLATLFTRGEHQTMLDLAWARLIENAAHDSICGCSVDDVMDQVTVRFKEADQIATEIKTKTIKMLVNRALDGKSNDRNEPTDTSDGSTGVFAFNPSSFARSEIALLEVSAPEEWEMLGVQGTSGALNPAQELEPSDPVVFKTSMTGQALIPFAGMLSGREVMDYWINSVEYSDDPESPAITIMVDTLPRGELNVEGEKSRLIAFAERHREAVVAITASRPRMRKIALKLPSIPPLSWGLFKLVAANPAELPIISEDRVRSEPRALESKSLRLEINDDGTVNLHHEKMTLSNLGRLVDGADWGDTYNYSPPDGDSLVETPKSISIAPIYDGPLIASIRVDRIYDIPSCYDAQLSGRSDELQEITISDTYEIRSGEPFVRVTTKFVNRCRDHRLRVHFPIPFEPIGSDAQTPFDVVHRSLDAEGGVHEFGLPTFPARGFVDVSRDDAGLALLFEHVAEYEVLDDELALTLLRSVGMLSRREMKYRPMPAGPEVPAPAAQCLGNHEIAYALYPHSGDWFDAGLVATSERFVLPVETSSTPPVSEPIVQDILGIDGFNVSLSACYRDHDRPTLRFWSSRNGGRICLRHEALETDILGRIPEDQDLQKKKNEFLLGPFEIKTIAIT